MNYLRPLPLFYLTITACSLIAAPMVIDNVEQKLQALEERVESRTMLVKSIQ